MDRAWVTYDSNMKPIGVSWGNPLGMAAEIDPELAIDFIHGHKNLEMWKIIKDGNDHLQLVEIKLAEKIGKYSTFWNLKVDNDFDISVIAGIKTIEILTNGNITMPLMLYASIKHDPTWLINTWNLSDMHIDNDKIFIQFDDAKNYSYYVDRIK